MVRKCRWLLATAMVLFGLAAAPAGAQWSNPFARLEYGVKPGCPFDCDSVTLWVSGDLTSTNWQVPVLMDWKAEGDSISVRYDVVFNPGPALPVLVPFDLSIPIGVFPEGAYRVIYTFYLDNPIATMPPVPFVVTDKFVAAPPGDQNCDGVVDIRDVVRLIVYVFRGGSPPDPDRRADVTCDGRADIVDVVRLIYHVFRGGAICDPCNPASASLIGDWRWVRAFGGIAGMERTPQTEGYSETVTYRADGIYELRRDSVLLAQVPYTLSPGSPSGFPAGMVIEYGGGSLISQLIVDVSGDSLKVMDLCWDCFEWTFVREP